MAKVVHVTKVLLLPHAQRMHFVELDAEEAGRLGCERRANR